MSDQQPDPPLAAPREPQRVAASSDFPGPTDLPPWVRYRTPLEGRWVAYVGADRVTLVISNASVSLWQGVGQRQGHPSRHRAMVVHDDEVVLRKPGSRQKAATYRWRIEGDRLSFTLVRQTPGASLGLAGLDFVSAG